MDFYQTAGERINRLSNTEKEVYNFVVRNLHRVKDMSIRELANGCFVSTATIFRLVKKLGYNGYSEFLVAIQETERASRHLTIPNIVHDHNYRDSYLKNVIEAVKVISDEKVERFEQIMSRYPKIYILAEGLSEEIARYFYHLLTIIGYEVDVPRNQYEIKSLIKRVKRDDVLLILSYTGDNQLILTYLQAILAIATPTIISITRADNNVIQNMSDLNFYIFADEIQYDDTDLTSRCGMIAIMETLLYKQITKEKAGVQQPKV